MKLKLANYSKCLLMCTVIEANTVKFTLKNLACLACVFEERYCACGGSDFPGISTAELCCTRLEMTAQPFLRLVHMTQQCCN